MTVEYLLLPLDRYHRHAQAVFDKAGAEGWVFTGAPPLRIGDPAKGGVDHVIFYRGKRDALVDALTRLADEWDAVNHADPGGGRWFTTATHACADELRLVISRTEGSSA